MYGPIIQGSQFRLRPPRLEDAPAMVEWFADPEVTALLSVRMGMSVEAEEASLPAEERTKEDTDEDEVGERGEAASDDALGPREGLALHGDRPCHAHAILLRAAPPIYAAPSRTGAPRWPRASTGENEPLGPG